MKSLTYYHNRKWFLVFFGLLSGSFLSCKKFIEINPPTTQIAASVVYENDLTATSVVTGIYSRMMDNYPGFANGGISLYAGLSADELQNYSSISFQAEFYANSLTANNAAIGNLWNQAWQFIYSANAVLEGLKNSSTISTKTRKQLEGEAKFIRAFCHFYLVNLFGEIPYITTTDYRINSTIPRQPVTDVYDNIISDLKEAQNLLADDYSFSNNERIRPNRFAAKALLSRVFLYKGDWANADEEASSIINNASVYGLSGDINNVFLKNSKETIWQLQSVMPGLNTPEGNLFILNAAPGSIAIFKPFLSSFEQGDSRKTNWIKSITVGIDTFYYPFKYKIKTASQVTEYYMVLRLAEQYLIRAEARANSGNIAGSQADLNVIRNRAGLANMATNDQASLLLAIEQERKVELFIEWGHRWLDLKRTGRSHPVLSTIKQGWQSHNVLYPIPLIQIQNDPNFSQNPGY